MSLLFPIEPLLPDGFSYFPNFISPEEETWLMDEMSKLPLRNFQFQGYEAKRRVASFGYDYHFDDRSLVKGTDIPAVFHPFIKKVAEKTGINQDDFAELLVTEYPVGAVINWHRDAPPFDLIAGISLASDCVFRLRPHEKMLQKKGSITSQKLERRSLYIIWGKARTDFQHSIAPVKKQRYSITLRTLRNRTT